MDLDGPDGPDPAPGRTGRTGPRTCTDRADRTPPLDGPDGPDPAPGRTGRTGPRTCTDRTDRTPHLHGPNGPRVPIGHYFCINDKYCHPPNRLNHEDDYNGCVCGDECLRCKTLGHWAEDCDLPMSPSRIYVQGLQPQRLDVQGVRQLRQGPAPGD